MLLVVGGVFWLTKRVGSGWCSTRRICTPAVCQAMLHYMLNRMPLIKGALSRAKGIVRGTPGFDTSANYWEKRYRTGGDSGAGSYNRLASFKAEVLNEFVATNCIQTVIEFGSGDGSQLELADYPQYVGVDISQTALELTRAKFASDPSKRFLRTSEVGAQHRADAAISLDVIYHLTEDDVFETYMRNLFDAAKRYVIIYSSNIESPGSSPHVRHREFSRWIETHRTDFRLLSKIPNRFPYSEDDPQHSSFADFYVFERFGNGRSSEKDSQREAEVP